MRNMSRRIIGRKAYLSKLGLIQAGTSIKPCLVVPLTACWAGHIDCTMYTVLRCKVSMVITVKVFEKSCPFHFVLSSLFLKILGINLFVAPGKF